MKHLLDKFKKQESEAQKDDLQTNLLRAVAEQVAKNSTSVKEPIKKRRLNKSAAELDAYKKKHKSFKKKKRNRSEIDVANIMASDDEREPPTKKRSHVRSVESVKQKYNALSDKDPIYKHPVGLRVKIKTTYFDEEGKPGSYSKGKPVWTYGTMVKKNLGSGKVGVQWDDDDYTESHWSHLQPIIGKEKTSAHTILAKVVMAATIQIEADQAEREPVLRWFFECLIRDDWRKWVKAAKRELKG